MGEKKRKAGAMTPLNVVPEDGAVVQRMIWARAKATQDAGGSDQDAGVAMVGAAAAAIVVACEALRRALGDEAAAHHAQGFLVQGMTRPLEAPKVVVEDKVGEVLKRREASEDER